MSAKISGGSGRKNAARGTEKMPVSNSVANFVGQQNGISPQANLVTNEIASVLAKGIKVGVP